MHDFHCKKADDMKSKLLAERTRYLKENEKGVKHMCKIMEEERKEAVKEREIQLATELLEKGELSEERVKELFKLTAKQLQAIKEKIAVLA